MIAPAWERELPHPVAENPRGFDHEQRRFTAEQRGEALRLILARKNEHRVAPLIATVQSNLPPRI
jgi:hypothetical protein